MTLKSDHPNYRNIHRTKTKKKKNDGILYKYEIYKCLIQIVYLY